MIEAVFGYEHGRALRHYCYETCIKGPMMKCAQNQSIARVVSTSPLNRYDVSGIQELRDVDAAYGTTRTVSLQNFEFEPLLALELAVLLNTRS
jgi:hypothetical protein